MHQVHCTRGDVAYAETHYHCCRCARVFRGASNFEVHQMATRCLTYAELTRRHLVLVDGAWRGRPMSEAAKARTRRASSPVGDGPGYEANLTA